MQFCAASQYRAAALPTLCAVTRQGVWRGAHGHGHQAHKGSNACQRVKSMMPCLQELVACPDKAYLLALS
jgi:hypothetical protein